MPISWYPDTRCALSRKIGSLPSADWVVDLMARRNSDIVEAPVNSNPAVYTWQGRQYVVFTAGGNQILTPRVGDQVVAYALPE